MALRYCDHIGWNSAKIISRLIILTISLSADPNMTGKLQILQVTSGAACNKESLEFEFVREMAKL